MLHKSSFKTDFSVFHYLKKIKLNFLHSVLLFHIVIDFIMRFEHYLSYMFLFTSTVSVITVLYECCENDSAYCSCTVPMYSYVA